MYRLQARLPLRKLGISKRDGRRCNVLLEMHDVGGSGDLHDPGLDGAQPGQRQLRRCDALAQCPFLHQSGQHDVFGQRLESDYSMEKWAFS